MEDVIAAVLVLFVAVWALLWIFLPFLVSGTNKRLDKLIEEVRALRSSIERQRR